MPPSIRLRPPISTDGNEVNRLVLECQPLDTNSVYCNLLQCTHFSGTSVAAEMTSKQGHELVGFISGYIIPERPNTLFIWQVAVGEKARGQGLATRMLEDILSRDSCKAVHHLETSITEDNQASWALFLGLADKLEIQLSKSTLFDCHQHFDGMHDTETLVRMGPIVRR